MKDLTGRVIVITGGARGIGRATAERLSAAGARVVIGDLDGALAKSVAAEVGRGMVGGHIDVTRADSWQQFLLEIADLGPIDVLVNNAGIMPIGSLLKESDDVTRSIIDVNVHGVIHGTKAVAPGMVERGRGHIINVASAVGRMAVGDGATYSASKFAAVGFSEAMRDELAPQGVAVSVVLPTVVLTELSAGVPPAKGIKPVTADDVAAVIQHVVEHPQKVEAWVPRWTQPLVKFSKVLPRRVQTLMTSALGADQVFHSADTSARAAYEERVRRS